MNALVFCKKPSYVVVKKQRRQATVGMQFFMILPIIFFHSDPAHSERYKRIVRRKRIVGQRRIQNTIFITFGSFERIDANKIYFPHPVMMRPQ